MQIKLLETVAQEIVEIVLGEIVVLKIVEIVLGEIVVPEIVEIVLGEIVVLEIVEIVAEKIVGFVAEELVVLVVFVVFGEPQYLPCTDNLRWNVVTACKMNIKKRSPSAKLLALHLTVLKEHSPLHVGQDPHSLSLKTWILISLSATLCPHTPCPSTIS